MTSVEYEQLIIQVEQLISMCEPMEADYWRGFRWGLKDYFYGKSDGTNQDHFTLINLAINGCRDPYMAAYARGYHDAFTGQGDEGSSRPVASLFR